MTRPPVLLVMESSRVERSMLGTEPGLYRIGLLGGACGEVERPHDLSAAGWTETAAVCGQLKFSVARAIVALTHWMTSVAGSECVLRRSDESYVPEVVARSYGGVVR